MKISSVRFTRAERPLRLIGLLGWAALSIDDLLYIDGLGIRRTLRGDLRVSWPAKANGRPVVALMNAEVRREFDEVILSTLAAEVGS